MPECYSIEEIKRAHLEIIWPTVRIRAKDAWGSGTVVYSKADAKGKYHTYVLTCHHVVASSIKVIEEWDQRVGMDVKTEIRTPVEVQFFYYENLSYAKGLAGSHRANIICYDEKQDIALLELDKTESVNHIANLYPEDKIDEVHVFNKVYACGAAMAHEPIATEGIITFMNEIIDDFDYWMSNAQIIFGNSGGAIFRFSGDRNKFEFIGMPARMEVSIMGYSASPVTHLGYFVPITRIYKLLEENYFDFIFRPEKNYEECKVKRKEAAEKDKQLFMARFGGSPLKRTEKKGK